MSHHPSGHHFVGALSFALTILTVPAVNASEACTTQKPATRAERLAVIDRAIAHAEAELAKQTQPISDWNDRVRIATFAAGSMVDETRFIGVDRQCWASFYEAHRYLTDNKPASAKDSARQWQTCLEAQLPDHLLIAKPYFACFR